MYLKHVVMAGIVAVGLSAAPVTATAQSTGSSTTGSQSSTSGQSSTTGSSTGSTAGSRTSTAQSQSGATEGQGGGANQEEIRQHLGGARQALAELTKLPAATQLQGEQRTQVANLISNFNTFATATTDWRPKYDVVDQSLDQLLAMAGDGDTSAGAATSASSAAPPAGAASGSDSTSSAPSTANPSTAGSASSAATSGGSLDPTIVAKLREVREHLDKFETSSGDPSFVVERIEKILDQAANGGSSSGDTAVGTSGTAGTSGSAAGASGSVTLDASQLSEIRKHLDSIRQAAKR